MSRIHCLHSWPPGSYHSARITPAILSLCPAPHCTPVICAAHGSQVGTPRPSLPSSAPSPRPHGISPPWDISPTPHALPHTTRPPASSLFCKRFPRSLCPCAMPWRLPCVACSSPAQLASCGAHPSSLCCRDGLTANCTLLHVQFPSVAPLSWFLALAPSRGHHGLLCWLCPALQMDPGPRGT